MKSYDVIIIGAGPGGLKCAEVLINSNYSVLVLEKNKKIGPKVCAGGLTGKDIKELNIPEKLLEFKYNKVNLFFKNKKRELKLNENFAYTIDRKELGQWQYSKIKKIKNIEIRTNSNVSKVEENYIIVNEEKIVYKYLVGADGSNSIVRKYLDLDKKKQDVAIQYIIPNVNFKNFEMYLDSKLFSSWYAWIFPHKNYVSIGTGCNPKYFNSKKLQDNFKLWLYKKNIDITNGKYEAFMINYDYRGIEFNNIFLVGDAAGLASGLTGEGIYQAFISGEEIGKKILNEKYDLNKINKLLKTKKLHNLILNVFIYSGPLRIILHLILFYCLKISYFRNKAIEVFA